MTALASPTTVLEALRGDRARRPPPDTRSAAGLRADLEDGVHALLGERVGLGPFVITTSLVRRAPGATALEAGAQGRLRGVLVTQLVRLASVGARVRDPFGDALAAWLAQRPSPELVAHLDSFDPDARARLASDVTAHFVTLSRALGAIPPTWTVRSVQRGSQRLGAGRVVLRDTIDLVVGSPLSRTASVALLDVTTSPLGDAAERAARFHALVETLRSGTVPLRTAVLSTATGDLWRYDVDRRLLRAAVGDVLDALAVLREAS